MDPYYFLREHVDKNGKQSVQLCYPLITGHRLNNFLKVSILSE